MHLKVYFAIILILMSCGTKISKSSYYKNEPKLLDWNRVETMNFKDLILNGKHQKYLSLSEFSKIYGPPDSIKKVIPQEICFSNFEEDSNSMYYYKNGSKFEVSKNEVVTEEFRFNKDFFLIFKGVTLNRETTEKDIIKLFPYAMSGIRDIILYDSQDGTMQFIALKEDSNNMYDGHVRLFFKNKKLKFLQWFFPC